MVGNSVWGKGIPEVLPAKERHERARLGEMSSPTTLVSHGAGRKPGDGEWWLTEKVQRWRAVVGKRGTIVGLACELHRDKCMLVRQSDGDGDDRKKKLDGEVIAAVEEVSMATWNPTPMCAD